MSKRHHVKHHRSRSHYRERLEARGLVYAPRMADPRLSDGKLASAKR